MEVSIISRISTPESVAVVILTIYNVHCGISIKLLRLVIEEGVVNSLFAIFFFCSIIGNIFVRSFTCIMRLDNNMVCCLVVVDAADFQTSISNNFCPVPLFPPPSPWKSLSPLFLRCGQSARLLTHMMESVPSW